MNQCRDKHTDDEDVIEIVHNVTYNISYANSNEALYREYILHQYVHIAGTTC